MSKTKKPADKTPEDAPLMEKDETQAAEAAAGADEAKLAAAQEKAEDIEKQLDEAKQTLLRTAAEYDNYRKRTQKEQEAAFGNGIGCAACEMLPILDTLDAAANADTSDEEYKKGVLLTLEKCKEVFGKLGIHEIEAMGQEFDPELHNAVMQEPADGAASGTVTRVMQKGYRLGDRVLRHAMVAVAP